jgi:hypothetical protein
MRTVRGLGVAARCATSFRREGSSRHALMADAARRATCRAQSRSASRRDSERPGGAVGAHAPGRAARSLGW